MTTPSDGGTGGGSGRSRVKTTVAFAPPKAKLFEMATVMSSGRDTLGT